MKLAMSFVGILLASTVASTVIFAAEKTTTKTTTVTTTSAPAPTYNTVETTSYGKTLAPSTLAFNFVALSQGKTNIYFDVGGMSERISPALSFRSYSNKEVRKKLQDANITVDRSLATVGASILALKNDNKSIIVNPYLYFGTEKDSVNTDSKNGFGVRAVGQINFNKTMAAQVGVDANNMEDTFKSDIYAGLAFSL